MEVHLGLAQEAYGGRNEVGGGGVVTMVLDALVQTLDELFC